MDDFLFDLRGYIVLKQAVSAGELAELNACVDRVLEDGKQDYDGYEQYGYHIHNVVEAGEPFERLIDHSSWSEHLQRYIGIDRPVLEDSGVIVRGQGQASKLHSGAHKRRINTQFRYHNGEFRCGQINVIVALNEVGPGDGGTMIVSGSHKSNLIHPAFASSEATPGGSLDHVEGSEEVLMGPGDALLFVDCAAHGSGKRVNPGVRRAVLYRYGPKWQTYRPSEELFGRLTQERRDFMNE
jgi:hypothetical protein